MKLGIIKLINKFYIKSICFKFQIRKLIFGFENATKMLINVDKRAVIPILRKNGATIGSDCDIETPIIFHNCKNFSNFIIGDNCHIGKSCFFDLKEKIVIKNNVTISMLSCFITHLDVGKSDLNNIYPRQKKSIVIEKNVYIGAGSKLLMGVILKESSFIAAGSLITKNVEPYTLVGGVPAKIIKKIEIKNKC